MKYRWCTHKLGFWGVVLIRVKKDDKEGYASGMAYLVSDMLMPFEFAVGPRLQLKGHITAMSIF